MQLKQCISVFDTTIVSCYRQIKAKYKILTYALRKKLRKIYTQISYYKYINIP